MIIAANVYHPRQVDCTAFQMHNPERPNSWYRPDVQVHTIPMIDLDTPRQTATQSPGVWPLGE